MVRTNGLIGLILTQDRDMHMGTVQLVTCTNDIRGRSFYVEGGRVTDSGGSVTNFDDLLMAGFQLIPPYDGVGGLMGGHDFKFSPNEGGSQNCASS